MPLPPLSDFQVRLRELIKEHVPRDYRGIFGTDTDEHYEVVKFNRRFARVLAEDGLLVPAWPVEYGGANLTYVRQLELAEEMQYWLEPRGGFYPGVNWIGPTLIRHGTGEQKRRHLPAIAQAQVVWCQGFSEPNAGSDLASAQTAAVPIDSGFKVTGQKIWVSYADYADWCILVARTSKGRRPHEGLSLLLLPMDSPGISVRTIQGSFGHHYNEIFFDGVLVDGENLLGEEGLGWQIITGGLDIERIATAWYAESQRVIDEILPSLTFLKGGTLRTARLRLADLEVSVMAARCMARRIYESVDTNSLTPYECSAAKVYMTQVYERTAVVARAILGDLGCLHYSAGDLPMNGHIERLVRWCKVATIAGGTNEIQRNIIAMRGLGLPRE